MQFSVVLRIAHDPQRAHVRSIDSQATGV